jgi:hypothetical protein
MLSFLKKPYIMIPGLLLLGMVAERKFSVLSMVGLGAFITPSA